jgi:hypothetical protein
MLPSSVLFTVDPLPVNSEKRINLKKDNSVKKTQKLKTFSKTNLPHKLSLLQMLHFCTLATSLILHLGQIL